MVGGNILLQQDSSAGWKEYTATTGQLSWLEGIYWYNRTAQMVGGNILLQQDSSDGWREYTGTTGQLRWLEGIYWYNRTAQMFDGMLEYNKMVGIGIS